MTPRGASTGPSYDSPDDERVIAIAAAADGVFVALETASSTERRYQVDRLDLDGGLRWSIPLSDPPTDIDVVSSGFVLVGVNLRDSSGFVGFVTRVDGSGSEIWSRGVNVDRDEGWGSNLAVDADGIIVQTFRMALRKVRVGWRASVEETFGHP
jgi:hypothetical protein